MGCGGDFYNLEIEIYNTGMIFDTNTTKIKIEQQGWTNIKNNLSPLKLIFVYFMHAGKLKEDRQGKYPKKMTAFLMSS